MSAYSSLVTDVRSHVPELTSQEFTDVQITRMLWYAFTELVSEAATLSEPSDPRMKGTRQEISSIPSDLTDGIPLASDIARIDAVEAELDGDRRRVVNLVDPDERLDYVEPTPAGYIFGATLYPIPGDGLAVWKHSEIEDGGWANLTKLHVQYVPEPAEPADETATIDVDPLFYRAAVYRAAADVAAVVAEGRKATLIREYESARDRIYGVVGMPAHSRQQRQARVRS